MKAGRILFGGVSALFLFMAIAASPGNAQQLLGPTPVPPPGFEPEVIPGQYIVELKRGVGRDAFINEHRAAPLHRYELIDGFAARMSQKAAARLAADARVRSVSQDLVVHAFPRAAGPPGSCQPWPECKKGGGGDDDGSGGGGDSGSCPASSNGMPAQEVPTGVSRIGANSTTATGLNVKVAVIDTGIDLCHPDLYANIVAGKNFVTKRASPDDDNGHGTHVAGIVAALDNGFGVRGVAPSAKLRPVKVLGPDGSGSLSTVIKGLDWSVRQGAHVANLSLGAFDLSLGSGPMCTAVANAVAAGTTVVVAAGNAAFEALFFTPANCVYSFTASAFVDFNGNDTASGSVTINGIVEYDETFANSFSNWSDYCWDMNGDGFCTAADSLVVNLMGPGVEIRSTTPTSSSFTLYAEGVDANYGILTGTSMATPHVAGAAALYIQTHPGATPAQVRTALTTGGECESGGPPAPGSIICPAPWTDDPDIGWESLLDASGL